MIWAVLAAMTAFAVAVLALPLRRARKVVARAAYDLAVYRDQLVELERDAARGLVDPAEAQAARAEIGRRMLAAAGTAEAADPAPAAGLRPMALAFAVAAPLAALSLYLASGSPRLPDRPYASRLDGGEESGEARIARLVGELQRRATERPDDPEIWQRIAVGLGALGRFDESVAAWRRVMRLTNDAAAFAGPFAEALVYEAQGSVTAEARALFERARAADPNDFRARFYLGLAKQQGGDPRAALQEWADMIALAPSDAPWLAMVRARFEATAVDAGIDPASIQPSEAARAEAAAQRAAPPAATPPAGEGAAAIAALPPAERERAIRTMVESLAARLESQPDDLEGWRRLGRAWLVIGETARGREALARAVALAPQRADVLADYAQSWSNELGEGRPLPEEFVAVMRRILAIDAGHADALWFVGLAEAAAGNTARAIELWERLVQRLPADSPEGREVRARLERLRAPR